jgi:polyferredoxin
VRRATAVTFHPAESNMNVVRALKSRRRRKRARHILVVWLITLGICALVWIVGYNVAGEDIYNTEVQWIAYGVILTILALIGGMAVTVGIFDRRNRL